MVGSPNLLLQGSCHLTTEDCNKKAFVIAETDSISLKKRTELQSTVPYEAGPHVRWERALGGSVSPKPLPPTRCMTASGGTDIGVPPIQV